MSKTVSVDKDYARGERERRMAMAERFSYHYEHTLDPKGRITIPSKFRDQLGNAITMTRGAGPCIRLLPPGEWARISTKYDAVDEDENPELYDKMRKLMFTSMTDNLPDKQGRLLLHPSMREYAGLDKEVIIAGANRHVEIWDKDRYFAFLNGDDA